MKLALPKWLLIFAFALAAAGSAVAYLYLTQRAEYHVRKGIGDMVGTGLNAAEQINAYRLKHGAMPQTLEQTGFVLSSRYVDAIEYSGSEIIITARFKPVQGKRIVLKREAGSDGRANWSCTSHGIPPEFLPARCR